MSIATGTDRAGTARVDNPVMKLHDSIASAQSAWRKLEAEGVCTPYQRLGWVEAYLASGFAPPRPISVMEILAGDKPIAVFPFEITRRFGVRIAQIIGMEISNGDAPLFDRDHARLLTPDALHQWFAQLPADLVNFHCVAPRIGPDANPLAALGGSVAPDHFYINDIEAGAAPFFEQSLPHKRRSNIRRSFRRLGETFGPVRLHRAQTEAEVDAVLAVFLDQRERRFAKMGVENVFAQPAFRRFFRTLAVEGLGHKRPSISFDALYAGDRIVATSVGTYGPHHYSQYINSTESGDASRYSLMGVTLSLLVDELRADDVTSLDMGLGDFDYKADWTHKQEVYDIVLPISLAGRAAAPAIRGARSLKRRIKQTPALWNAARAVRRAVASARKRPGASKAQEK